MFRQPGPIPGPADTAVKETDGALGFFQLVGDTQNESASKALE